MSFPIYGATWNGSYGGRLESGNWNPLISDRADSYVKPCYHGGSPTMQTLRNYMYVKTTVNCYSTALGGYTSVSNSASATDLNPYSAELSTGWVNSIGPDSYFINAEHKFDCTCRLDNSTGSGCGATLKTTLYSFE